MNIIPFESQLPAHIAALEGIGDDDLSGGVGGGYAVVSIKGKVFHIVRGDEKTLVTKPGGEANEPASSIEVVILRANPHLSKIYYAQKYVEGSDEKPTCYSNNGLVPEEDAQEKQSTKCATCPHNQWGSRITDSGKKGKACADARRIAVAPVGQLNDPMLLRVPAASLAPLAQYGDMLKKRGVKYPMVSTRIGFDYTVAHPALTFKPVGFLSEELVVKAAETARTDIVAQITGAAPLAQGGNAPVAAPQLPAAATAPVQATMPVAEAQVVTAPAKDKKPKATPVKVIDVATPTDLEAELGKVLTNAGFDG